MHEFAPVSSRTPRSAIAERPVPRTLPTRIHQLAGNRAFGRLQPNLMVNQPGDAYEIEADRVTDHVMGMPKPPVQRECACGGTCADCGEQEESHLQRVTTSFAGAHGGNSCELAEAPATVGEVLSSSGEPLDAGTRATMEGRFGQDFGHVRIHRDSNALASARAVAARAYTVSNHVVFGEHQYAPTTPDGQRLLAHELTHVLQQGGGAAAGPLGPLARVARSIQRRAAPYIKKVTVHLNPPQSADLEWQGTAPASATGSDHFTVSTGKGYDNPGDPPGTCTRHCCTDPDTQCAPPWNRPDRVGACCTYYGDSFWTGTPQDEHNGWKWWTPIQPYYSQRGIALHQHDEVTGQPIGHGCVRMDEPNAKRIYDFSNGRRTNVTIDGRAAPVGCESGRRCSASGSGAALGGAAGTRLTESNPVPGREGEMT